MVIEADTTKIVEDTSFDDDELEVGMLTLFHVTCITQLVEF